MPIKLPNIDHQTIPLIIISSSIKLDRLCVFVVVVIVVVFVSFKASKYLLDLV